MGFTKNFFACLVLVILLLPASAQEKTRVHIQLRGALNKTCQVEVCPPPISSETIDFIVPVLVPGTYWPTHYIRYYSDFKAWDAAHHPLKLKRHGNRVSIHQAKTLSKLSYTVCETAGSKKIWDAPFGCGGTVFRKDKSFLLNFALLTGYFRGFEQKPFELQVEKPEGMFAATSLTLVDQTVTTDVFQAPTYFALVDSPTLYCMPDTSSFRLGGCHFFISVFAEQGHMKSTALQPAIQKAMQGIYSGFQYFPVQEYHFLIYAVRPDSLKGYVNRLGLYSALEHLHSSVYYLEDLKDTATVNHILTNDCTHEFLHTWTPLTIHSNKIEPYPFEKADMSENMWFYEGFTDYLCDYLIEKNKLYPGQFRNKLGDAIAFTEAQKKMSFAASCRSLQTHTAFTALKKYKRMSGFYERGKLVAFCLDAKLMEQSNGAFRLPDLMTKLYTRYGFKSPFNDTVLPAVLTQLSYPTTKLFMESYVKGAQMPPWQTYFDSLGWVYVPKGGLIPSFGRYDFVYNPVEKKLFFKHVKQNSLGLQSNDVLLSIPNALPGEGFSKFFQPDKNDTLSITIQRAGNRLMLTGKADGYRKLKGSAVFGRGKTATQQRYRNLFWANKAE